VFTVSVTTGGFERADATADTTGEAANGAGADCERAVGGTAVYESLTAGMRRRTTCLPGCPWKAGAFETGGVKGAA
jgi:hypothetical protein